MMLSQESWRMRAMYLVLLGIAMASFLATVDAGPGLSWPFSASRLRCIRPMNTSRATSCFAELPVVLRAECNGRGHLLAGSATTCVCDGPSFPAPGAWGWGGPNCDMRAPF